MDYTHNVDTIGVRLKEETIPSGYAYEGSRYKQFTFESKEDGLMITIPSILQESVLILLI